MHMSKACLPPIQPSISEADRAHPLFGLYQQHRSFCSDNLIEASSFGDWLYQYEQDQIHKGFEAHPRFKEWQQWMWTNQGGAKGRGPKDVPNVFPHNFRAWLDGARW